MEINTNSIIGEIVAENYKTASIFKKYGIDFCCNGNRSIGEALNSNIDIDSLLNDIINTATQNIDNNDYQNWSLDFLSDYIYNKHHLYVEKQIPEIKFYLAKICSVHSKHHPELIEIKDEFIKSANELTTHMKKEELILFPYIKKIVQAQKEQTALAPAPFLTIANPINAMHQEHDNEGSRFRKIAELTNNYTPPTGACNSFKVTYKLLQEFEEDLHKHIHLENNILFKKALQAEQELR